MGELSQFFWRSLAIFILCLPHLSQANSPVSPGFKPIRNPTALDRPREEEVLHVRTARVVLADYDLLRKDFPALAPLSEAQIDQWLIENAAWISIHQVAQGQVANTNSEIVVSSRGRRGSPPIKKTAYRPHGYGRALVLALPDGLIDAKGAGARAPSVGSHSNGLASLTEAIQEFAMEKLIERICFHEQQKCQTLGTYAVLDYGFLLQDQYHDWRRAGLILRQAHHRIHAGFKYIDPVTQKEDTGRSIEILLRQYGISSCGEHFFDRAHDKLYSNIQRSSDGALLDFGTFISLRDFDHILTWKDRSGGYLPEQTLLDPRDSNYVHPNPSLRVPVRFWGAEKKGGIWVDHLWNWAEDWSNRVVTEPEARYGLAESLSRQLNKVQTKWKGQ